MSKSFNTAAQSPCTIGSMNSTTTARPAKPNVSSDANSPLSQYVSGPSSRCWGLPLLREMWVDYLGFVQRLQRDHGDLTRIRIGKEDIWDLMSPELVREALVTHVDSLIRWERGISVFEQVFGRSVLVTEGDTWQRQRRMLMPAFSPRRVAGYTQLMTDAARSALDEAVPAGQAEALVSMETLWTGVAMDVILRTLFSESARADARDAAWATQILSAAAFREMFLPFSLPNWLPLPGNTAKRRALTVLRDLVQRHISTRQQEAGSEGLHAAAKRTDLLNMLLALRDDVTGEPLSPQEVFDQCMVSFQAGHETSATALLWWSRLMAEHPESARRAQIEVDTVLQGGMPGAEQMAQLPWLTATLKEALRLYPPVAALMTRRTTAPFTLGGRAVPRGTMLRVTPWVLHRDERWFARADTFVPDRFLDGAAPIEKGAWIPFGVGPRVCIGQHFAMLEMTLLAAMLLQRYTLTLPAGAAPCAPKLNVTLRPATPVLLRLQKRQAAYQP